MSNSQADNRLRRLLVGMVSLLCIVLIGASLAGLTADYLSQTLLLEAGLVGLILGNVFRPGFRDGYRNAGVILLNTLIFLLLVDILAGAFYNSRIILRHYVGSSTPEAATSLRYYEEQDWADIHWQEWQQSYRFHFVPFVGWRREPMSAQTINVDEAGLRTTPGANCSEDAYQVWVLGGSTVWGFGSPDWGTIPAYLQQTLDEQRNGPVCVLNLGENAFVMTQNVIELEERLKDGQVPDVAIFYNGFNETFTAYETGDPERTFFNSNFTNLFVRDGLFSTDAFDLVAERSYTFALLKEWVDSQPTEEAPNSYQVQGIATRTMAAAILESYFANVEMVQALGEAYNFRVYFFWQPVLLAHDKPGTPVERATLASEATPAMAELFTETYRQMVSQDRADFYSLGAVFDDVTEGLYFDLVHVTPVGNALIAAAMLEVIE